MISTAFPGYLDLMERLLYPEGIFPPPRSKIEIPFLLLEAVKSGRDPRHTIQSDANKGIPRHFLPCRISMSR